MKQKFSPLKLFSFLWNTLKYLNLWDILLLHATSLFSANAWLFTIPLMTQPELHLYANIGILYFSAIYLHTGCTPAGHGW